MGRDYSSESLLSFLREAALAGRMHPATARSRRKAAEALLEHLNAEEAADLRCLDYAVLRERIANNPRSSLRPEVAELYAERLAAALEAFAEFAPEISAAVPAESPASEESPRDADALARDDRSAQRALEAVHLGMDRMRADVFPIPLDEDRVVFLHGIPHDLTPAEAGKIIRVVEALAQGIEDS
ncbi:MAG: hypothetical protein AAGI72_01935 [Pseudomonadota bacterium]